MRVGSFKKYLRSVGFRGYLQAVRAKATGRVGLLELNRGDCKYPLWLRVPSSDVPTYKKVFIDREYDFSTEYEPSVIVDAGANVGFASIYFANRFPNARIIAIEPETDNFHLLLKNVKSYPNVVAVHAALWHETGEINLIDPGLGQWGFMTESSENGDVQSHYLRHLVPAVTVEDLLEKFGIEQIDVFKIDIEGAEKEVFRDTSTWIDKVNSLIVELHERMKPGCNRNFYCGTPGFGLEWRCGENVFLSKKGYINPIKS
jgi:FkbM family methyltransferase